MIKRTPCFLTWRFFWLEFADVFFPEGGVFFLEGAHEVFAFFEIEIDDFDALV